MSGVGYLSDPSVPTHDPSRTKYYDANVVYDDPLSPNSLLSSWGSVLSSLNLPLPPYVIEVVACTLLVYFLIRLSRGRQQNQHIASAMIASIYTPMAPSFARIGAYSHRKRVQRSINTFCQENFGHIPENDEDLAALLFESSPKVRDSYDRLLREGSSGSWGNVPSEDVLKHTDFSALPPRDADQCGEDESPAQEDEDVKQEDLPTDTVASSTAELSATTDSATTDSATADSGSATPVAPAATTAVEPAATMSASAKWWQYLHITRSLIETHPHRYFTYASGYVPRVISAAADNNDETMLGMYMQFHLRHRHNVFAPLLRFFELDARTDTSHDTVTFTFFLPRSAQPLIYVYALEGTECKKYHTYTDVQQLIGSPPSSKASFEPKSDRNDLIPHFRRYLVYTDTPSLVTASPVATLLMNRLHAVASATCADVELLSIYVSDQSREENVVNGHESIGNIIDQGQYPMEGGTEFLGIARGEQEVGSVVRVRWRFSPALEWKKIANFIVNMNESEGDERTVRAAKAIRRIGNLSLHVAETFAKFRLHPSTKEANLQKRFDLLRRVRNQLRKNKS